MYVGELPTEDTREISGTLYVQNQWTFFIQLFSFRAGRESEQTNQLHDCVVYYTLLLLLDVFLYYYPPGVTPSNSGEGGVKINVSAE